MSVTAISLINEASLLVGDPLRSRTDTSVWLAFLNKASREAATRMRLVKWIDTFEIEAGVEVHSMPDGCQQVTRMEYSPTPDVPGSYREVRELFEDEWRAQTTWQYPQGEPTRYFAEPGYFYWDRIPTVGVPRGGKVTYWGLPDPILDAGSGLFGLADALRDLAVEYMLVVALEKHDKYEEAQVKMARWEKRIMDSRSTMEDRSADRRPRVRIATIGGRQT